MTSAVSVRSTYFAMAQENEGGNGREEEPEGKRPPNWIWWGLAAMPFTFGTIVLVAGWAFALIALVVAIVALVVVLALG
jgi:hypothetical protein